MDIIESGYIYKLESFNKTAPQEIRFTQRLITGEFIDGTTNEEVIDMMIARFYALNSRNFSVENQCAIIMLKSIKELLNKRLDKKIRKSYEAKKENFENKRRAESEELFEDFERDVRSNLSRTRGS